MHKVSLEQQFTFFDLFTMVLFKFKHLICNNKLDTSPNSIQLQYYAKQIRIYLELHA